MKKPAALVYGSEDRPPLGVTVLTGVQHAGVNAIFLEPGMGGLETYTKELVPRVRHLRPDLRISVFLSAEGLPVLRDMPWASEWGLAALAVLLTGAGLVVLRKN